MLIIDILSFLILYNKNYIMPVFIKDFVLYV